MVDVDEITLRGEKPIKEAASWLADLEEDDRIAAVTIKFEATGSKPTIESEVSKSESKSESNKDQLRAKGDIRSGTSHHAVAYALAKSGGIEDYVPAPMIKNKVQNMFIDINETSIYPALTNLWERKLADRERKEGVYHYKLTEHGKDRVKDLGEPSNGNDK